MRKAGRTGGAAAPRAERILALVPARAGSKGIKDKNLCPLGGTPLIGHAVRAAVECRRFADVIVSTDSRRIADVAVSYGARAPFLRPAELASDSAKTVDAVLHALDSLEASGSSYDAVCLLQVTSPLRTSDDISACIDLWLANRPQSVVSLARLDEPHPYKLKQVLGGKVHPFLPGLDSGVPRQVLPELYMLNGAVYIVSTATLRKHMTFFDPSGTVPYVMPQERSVNINGPQDFMLAQLYHGSRSGESPEVRPPLPSASGKRERK